MIDRRQMLHALAASTSVPLALAAPAAAHSALNPRRTPAGIAPLPSPWTETGALQRAGGLLHYAAMGSNEDLPPIILLHKLGGWIADWRDVAPYLAENRRVIAFDLPGHGDSLWNGPPPRVQTLFETAALIIGALQELKLGPVDIAGTSLGGCIGVVMAALCPDRVRRLALPSCVLGRASTEAEVAKKESDQASFWDAEGLPLPVDPEFSRQIFGLTNYQRIGVEQDHSRARAGHWIKPQERGVAFTHFLDLLPRVTAPVLLLYGDQDHFFLKYREAAEALLPDARSLILPQASGLHVQDQPRPTADALSAFFSA